MAIKTISKDIKDYNDVFYDLAAAIGEALIAYMIPDLKAPFIIAMLYRSGGDVK